jgi:MYXO-CTERM domain-containing protein
MRGLIGRALLVASVAALAGLALLDPAWAEACFPRGSCTTTPTPVPAPGPLIGFGLPLAAAALGALLIVRRSRKG